MKQMEAETKEISNLKRDLEFAESEKVNKMKDYEKQLKTFKLEKEDLARDLTDAQEKLKLQSKELKDALQQRKMAMSEYTEVTDKWVDVLSMLFFLQGVPWGIECTRVNWSVCELWTRIGH